jgi:hypothetical protein
MKVAFNLNYLLVFGLLICIVILVYILIKHIFVTENSLVKKQAKPADTNKDGENSVSSNIDFFKKQTQIIKKSNIITHRENNITYQFIDLGDKILIMEEAFFIPDTSSVETEKIILASDDSQINFGDTDGYIPDVFNSNLPFESSVLEEPIVSFNKTDLFLEEEAQKIQREIADSTHNYAIGLEEEEIEEEEETSIENLIAEYDDANPHQKLDFEDDLNRNGNEY